MIPSSLGADGNFISVNNLGEDMERKKREICVLLYLLEMPGKSSISLSFDQVSDL